VTDGRLAEANVERRTPNDRSGCSFVVLLIIYAQNLHGAGGWIEGARFGGLIGMFMVFAHVAHNYVNLNIGPKLAAEMASAELLQWTLVGIVIGTIYKPVASS
jgi:hypothetical protein